MLAMTMKEMSGKLEEGYDINEVIKIFLSNHKRIVYEGNCYSEEWKKELKERNLSNLTNTVDAINVLNNKELTKMLVSLGIFTESEITSRYEIMLDSYSKTIQVEASTALYMAKNQIFPACLSYLNKISNTYQSLDSLNMETDYLKNEVVEINELLRQMKDLMEKLEVNIKQAQEVKYDFLLAANLWKNKVVVLMDELRNIVDTLESKVDEKSWPMPTYIDLLFGIK